MAINRNDWINEVKQDAYGATGNPAQLSTASGSAPSYSARAWVNFNGTGTVAIRGSGNVSSITDNGTGDYTINFQTPMQDANFAVAQCGSTVIGTYSRHLSRRLNEAQSNSYVRVFTAEGAYDIDYVQITIFR